MHVLALCAGVGGLELGLKLATGNAARTVNGAVMERLTCTRCEHPLDDKDLHFIRTLAKHLPYCRACMDKEMERRHKRELEKAK